MPRHTAHFVTCSLLLWGCVVHADSLPDDNNVPTQVVGQTTCPSVDQLVLRHHHWFSKNGGWRSYDASFDHTIKSFVAAQWQGLNVGKVLCVYVGNQTYTFPVTLQRGNLVHRPSGSHWKRGRHGHINCVSHHVLDCPFVLVQQHATPLNNPHDVQAFLNQLTPHTADTGAEEAAT